MKHLLLALLLLVSTDPREISRVNSLKKEAEKAYLAKDFAKAVASYRELDSLGADDPAIKLNLAHALYQLNDTSAAKAAYQSASMVPDKKIQSIAYQQLGAMAKKSNKLEEALNHFKSSLKANPANEGARYDYELVKKLLDKQKLEEQQNQQDQNKEDEQNKDQQDQQQNQDEQKGDNQDQKSEEQKEQEANKDGEKKEGENQEGEEQESEEQPTPEEMMQKKLEEMNISEEKAKMILEAMKNNEVQYLQQQRRKPTKRPPSGKPDW